MRLMGAAQMAEKASYGLVSSAPNFGLASLIIVLQPLVDGSQYVEGQERKGSW